ncbi:MAG: hypothetical protein ACRDNF_16805, partial [Streptosporangiaceae bacterium]
MAAFPASVCWAMATICGLATAANTTPASPAQRSLTQARAPPREGSRISQGSRAATASIPAMIIDSWSVSSAAPSTTPRITARAQPGRRASRTAAS